MQRVLVIGGNGSGKTTMAAVMAEKLKLPLVHLDTLYWRDNWEHVTNDEFDRLLMEELVKPEWIIDGNINRTLPVRLKYCDTVIYMDYPAITCFFGALRRILKNIGKSRPDMGGNCREGINLRELNFLKLVLIFNHRFRARNYSLLAEATNVKTIILKNRKQTRLFLNDLRQMEVAK